MERGDDYRESVSRAYLSRKRYRNSSNNQYILCDDLWWSKASRHLFLGGYPVSTSFLPIQDFAILNLQDFTWQNKCKDVNITVLLFGYPSDPIPDRICCFTCDTTACPPARLAPRVLTFPTIANHTFLLYGGLTLTGSLDDLWEYDIVTDSWTQLNISTPIAQPRLGATVAGFVSPSTNLRRIVMFGGSYAVVSGSNYSIVSRYLQESLSLHHDLQTD